MVSAHTVRVFQNQKKKLKLKFCEINIFLTLLFLYLFCLMLVLNEILGGFYLFCGVLCYEGLRPYKNWFMLSLKFPRQKIVKGDFLKRYGDFRA